MTRLAGAVLAGGAGSRLGADKAGVEVDGRRLVNLAWRALAPATGPVFLQGTAHGPPGLHPAPDRRPGQGPLAGLEAALLRAEREGRPGVAVLAVDLPRVTAPVILALLARWRSLPDAGGRAVVAGTPRGIQPLAGIYGTVLAPSLSSWLDGDGSRAVHAWLDSLGPRVVTVPYPELRAAAGHDDVFLNVNTPDELARARTMPPPGPPLVSVTGWKDAGKTSVAVALVRSLVARGLRVAALKHGHGFRLDAEGTDSWRLRYEGGARTVVLAGPDGFAALGGWPEEGESSPGALAGGFAGGADLVVAEGWKSHPLPAVEVLGGGARTAGGGRDRPSVLWRPDGPDRDRFLARVGAEGEEGEGGPPLLLRKEGALGDRLADLVTAALLPERAGS